MRKDMIVGDDSKENRMMTTASNDDFSLHKVAADLVNELGVPSKETETEALRIVDHVLTPRTRKSSYTDQDVLQQALRLADTPAKGEIVTARFQRLQLLNASTCKSKLAFLTHLRQLPSSSTLRDMDGIDERRALHNLQPSTQTSTPPTFKEPPVPATLPKAHHAAHHQSGSSSTLNSQRERRKAETTSRSTRSLNVVRSSRHTKAQWELSREAHLRGVALPQWDMPNVVAPICSLPSTHDVPLLGSHHPEHIDLLLCRDVLAMLRGDTGDYIVASRNAIDGLLVFTLNEGMTPSARDYLLECMPVGVAVDRIRQLVQPHGRCPPARQILPALASSSRGLSSLALCRSAIALIDRVTAMVTDWETRWEAAYDDLRHRMNTAAESGAAKIKLSSAASPLTLASMTYDLSEIRQTLVFLVPTMTKMLEDGLVGGQLVSHLNARLAAVALTLNGTSPHYDELARAVVTPFLHLLADWLNEGSLARDCAREFFVWELSAGERLTTMAIEHVADNGRGQRRFEMHVELCPESLREHAKDILTCGLQVISMREAGAIDMSTPALSPDASPKQLRENVRNTVLMRDREIWELMKRDGVFDELHKKLSTILLLTRSDWLDEVLDAVETDIMAPTVDVLAVRVDRVLDQVHSVIERRLRMDKDDVRVCFEPRAIADVLTDLNAISGTYANGRLSRQCVRRHAAIDRMGSLAQDAPLDPNLAAVDAFCLDLVIHLPCRYMFSPNVIAPYKYVFRRLLEVRLAMRGLSETVVVLHALDRRHRRHGGSMMTHLLRVCRVRTILFEVVANYAHHCHVDVIGTAEQLFVKEYSEATHLSTKARETMMDSVVDGLMLNDGTLMASMGEILAITRGLCARIIEHFGEPNVRVSSTCSHSQTNLTIEVANARGLGMETCARTLARCLERMQTVNQTTAVTTSSAMLTTLTRYKATLGIMRHAVNQLLDEWNPRLDSPQ